ncbi:MAG: TlpA family protein disulfide reductase [Rhodospirillaceae bacterium]
MRWAAFFAAVFLCAGTAAAGDAQPFVRGSWQDIRDRHADRPLVVHLWGITCGPCLTELPRWSRLRETFPKMDLVLVAADPAPMPAEKVAATLAKAGLGDVESWNFADRFTARLRFEIDPAWRGELPRTLLIDPAGTVTVMSGVTDWKAIEDWARGR